MDRIMLEVVVSGRVSTPKDIYAFIQCTLLSAEFVSMNASDWKANVAEACKKSLKALGDQGFLEWRCGRGDSPDEFVPLKLGRAAVAAGLAPDAALMIHEDVLSIAQAINLESDLHLMYLVAPVDPSQYLDWVHVNRVVQAAHANRRVVKQVCQLSSINLQLAADQARRGRNGWAPEVRLTSLAVCCTRSAPLRATSASRHARFGLTTAFVEAAY
jgi:hypothetical protein